MIVFAEYSNIKAPWFAGDASSSPGTPPVTQFGSTAAEQLSTLPDHIGRESELLAVKDKGSLIGIEVILTVIASVLENLDPRLLLIDSMIVCCDPAAVDTDLGQVFGNSGIVWRDAVFEGLHVGLELDHGETHGFEGHHNFGLSFEGTFILIGVEDWLTHVESIDL